MSAALWALVLLPLAVGVTLLCAGVGSSALCRRVQRAAGAVAVGTTAMVVALAVLVATSRPSAEMGFMAGAPAALRVDGLSSVVVLMVASVSLLVMVFAAVSIQASRARFFGLMLVFIAAVLITATAATIPVLLAAWEVMGATSYGLIAFWWRDSDRVVSGTMAFVVTRVGDIGLYLAAGAALAVPASGGQGAMSVDRLAELPAPWSHVAAAGLLAAAFGKAAQLPFSFWLSRAMAGPSPVSALLHSAAMVAMGGYLLLRVHPLLVATGWAASTAAWGGAVTAVAMGAVALAQRDLKQLLAASTCAQLGFVILAAGTTGSGAVTAGTAHLVAHASTKALLFLAAGAWLSALGTKQLRALRGAGRAYPVVGVTFTIGALSLAGVPPLALWATKDSVLAVAREQSTALYLTGLAGAILSALYAGKMLALVWRAPLSTGTEYDTEEQGSRLVPGFERVPLIVLAVGAAALGVLSLPPLADRFAGLTGQGAAAPTSALELLLSAGLAVGATVIAVRRPSALPQPRWATSWLGLEGLAYLLVVRPTLALAGTLSRADDRLADAIAGLAPATQRVARAAAAVDGVGVEGALGAVTTAAGRLGDLARRPQTGQLHQYYAQAAVGLGAGLLFLLVVR